MAATALDFTNPKEDEGQKVIPLKLFTDLIPSPPLIML